MSDPLIALIRRQSPNVRSAPFYQGAFDISHQLIGATSERIDHVPHKTRKICCGGVERMRKLRVSKYVDICKAYAVPFHIFFEASRAAS